MARRSASRHSGVAGGVAATAVGCAASGRRIDLSMPELADGAPPVPVTPLGDIRGWRFRVKCAKCRRVATLPVGALIEQYGTRTAIASSQRRRCSLKFGWLHHFPCSISLWRTPAARFRVARVSACLPPTSFIVAMSSSVSGRRLKSPSFAATRTNISGDTPSTSSMTLWCISRALMLRSAAQGSSTGISPAILSLPLVCLLPA